VYIYGHRLDGLYAVLQAGLVLGEDDHGIGIVHTAGEHHPGAVQAPLTVVSLRLLDWQFELDALSQQWPRHPNLEPACASERQGDSIEVLAGVADISKLIWPYNHARNLQLSLRTKIGTDT